VEVDAVTAPVGSSSLSAAAFSLVTLHVARETMTIPGIPSIDLTGNIRGDAELAERVLTATQRFQKAEAQWGLGTRDWKRWSMDQAEGILRFQGSTATLEARAQFLGSFDPEASTWEWAWNNPHAEPAAAVDAALARDYGAAHGIAVLTRGIVSVPDWPSAAWLATLAADITDAAGVYASRQGRYLVVLSWRDMKRIPAPSGTSG
jgi:hypothetical protein